MSLRTKALRKHSLVYFEKEEAFFFNESVHIFYMRKYNKFFPLPLAGHLQFSQMSGTKNSRSPFLFNPISSQFTILKQEISEQGSQIQMSSRATNVEEMWPCGPCKAYVLS